MKRILWIFFGLLNIITIELCAQEWKPYKTYAVFPVRNSNGDVVGVTYDRLKLAFRKQRGGFTEIPHPKLRVNASSDYIDFGKEIERFYIRKRKVSFSVTGLHTKMSCDSDVMAKVNTSSTIIKDVYSSTPSSFNLHV